MNINKMELKKEIIFWLLTALLGVAPYFRGVFFITDNLYFGIIIAALAISYLFIYGKQSYKKMIPKSIMDYGVVLFFLAHLIAAASAIKPVAAVETLLKAGTITIFYFLCSGIIFEKERLEKFLRTIYAAGVGVALLGIAGYAGLNIKGLMYTERISSSFQYPNVLATYLSVIVFWGFYFSVIAQKRDKYLYAAGNITIILALIGTASRGAFLVLPVAIIALLLGYHKDYRFRLFITIVYNIITAAIFGLLLGTAKENPGRVILIVFMALLVNVMFEFLLKKSTRLTGFTLTRKKLIIASIVITTLLAITMVSSYKYLPKGKVLSRITRISMSERSIVERGYFYSDALKIIKEYPVLGVGGGGWSAIYQKYQSYGYQSNQVHNYYLQTWVEAGILGFGSLVILILSTTLVGIKIIKSTDESTKTLGPVLFSGVMVIMLHSAIDFTMAYSAMTLLLWSLLGCLNNIVKTEQENIRSESGFSKVNLCFLILPVFILFSSLSMLIGLKYGNAAASDMRAGNVGKMNESLIKATVFDPFRPQNYAWLARNEFYLGRQKNDKNQIDQALKHVEKAISLDTANQEYYLVKANILFYMNEVEKGVKVVETAYSLDPWDLKSFELLVYTYTTVGNYYYLHSEPQKAMLYVEKALYVPVTMNLKIKKLGSQKLSVWKTGGVVPVMTDKMAQNIKKAIYISRSLKK